MEQLKSMKQMLMSCAQGQMGHLDSVDAKELGEVIDMIKDLEEAIYYKTITEAMNKEEKGPKEKEHHYYYTDYRRDGDRMYYDDYGYMGPMYYSQGRGGNGGGGNQYASQGSSSNSSSGSGQSRGYQEYPMYPVEMRDYREGRSPMMRKYYMESKEKHHDKAKQMKDLEKYLQELSTDVTEMVADASPEELTMLHQKLTTLANKVK